MSWENWLFAYAKTKTQISFAVTACHREADQRLCFRFTDSTIPLLPKTETSSFQPSSMAVQPGFVWDQVKQTKPVFSQRGSYSGALKNKFFPRTILNHWNSLSSSVVSAKIAEELKIFGPELCVLIASELFLVNSFKDLSHMFSLCIFFKSKHPPYLKIECSESYDRDIT